MQPRGGSRLSVRAVKAAGLAFIGAKRRAFTEEADRSGAGFGQEGYGSALQVADLERSRILGEIGNLNLLGWRKYEKTLDPERIGKLAPEFIAA